MSEPKHYMVLLQLGDTAQQRLAKIIPDLTTILNYLADDKPELLFRAVRADIFGYLLTSKFTPIQIINEI